VPVDAFDAFDDALLPLLDCCDAWLDCELPEPVAPVLLFEAADDMPLCADELPDCIDDAPD
jgi:hypothetical protein